MAGNILLKAGRGVKLSSFEQRRDEIIAEADRIFGDPEKATRWLSKPKSFLDEMTPLDALKTASGYAKIKEMLIRIEYGMIG